MRAIVQDSYGPPDVLRIESIAEPQIGANEILVEVHATSVTTADWRFRAAAFPVGMRLIGRLLFGLFRPRNRTTGREFAGRVIAIGREVSRFRVGDDVLGVAPNRANAERIAVPESGAVVRMPARLTHAEAVALPFGSITAITFVRDVTRVRPGDRVLVTGASGGVGVYAVQVAKHFGAEVTAVCSTDNVELVRSLGADHVIDYTRRDPRDVDATYDVIIDCVGRTTFADYRGKLSAKGRHAFVEGTLRELWQSIVTRWISGPTVLFAISNDNRKAFEGMLELVEAGAFRPVLGHRLPMTEVVAAHRIVDARHRRGAIVLDWPAANVPREVVPISRAG
jgi:NADPH:quinone reductase-like Zn-dependent oxidoreductase